MDTIYDYKQAVHDDVLNALQEINTEEYTEYQLFELLYNDDYVTGIASGSYTMSRYKAQCNLINNQDLVEEAIDSGLITEVRDIIDAEKIDVIIRCLILERDFSEILNDFKIKRGDILWIRTKFSKKAMEKCARDI